MSGLHEAFDEIVADVPVYGDLDRAIEQAERDRRHRHGAVAGLVAAAAVLVVIAGAVAGSGDTDTAPPVSPSPTPAPPSPTPAKSQSPDTWVDTPLAGTQGNGWDVPNPLATATEAWLPVVVEHLDRAGRIEDLENSPSGVSFWWPAEGSDYAADTASTSAYAANGYVGLIHPGGLNPFDGGCDYLLVEHDGAPAEQVSCSAEQFEGPNGERAKVSRYGRRCGAYEGGGPAPATCGDYTVAVAVERPDGMIGYVKVDGRGTPDFNPIAPAAMAAVAADPRLTLPETAYAVPSDRDVASEVQVHFPRFREDAPEPGAMGRPGAAGIAGGLGRLRLSVTVWPAGEAPRCGDNGLVDCVERRVYGPDDPTTVFVGAWDDDDWADCCPRNSRANSRQFVYVGPRHTVVVSEFMLVGEGEDPISAELDQRLIDLALDPAFQ